MLLEPSRLVEYEIANPLGSGATASVFQARHIATGTRVAIKMLDASARGSRELRERLAREAVLLTGVESPYVSRLIGFGWEEDQPFLVLELLEGETLSELLKREARLSAHELIDWVEQLLIGVRDCHKANVIHRDIKPSNIFLVRAPTGERTVKLIDFGVGRLNELASAGLSLTSTHHLIGSMGYMAPEQLEAPKGVGPAADLYAVGVVIFRAVSGRLPFVGRSFEALTRLKVESDAPRLSSVVPVAAPLDDLVARALARKPADRFGSATEMLEAWWRVAAALDRQAPLPAPSMEVVVEFDETSVTVPGTEPFDPGERPSGSITLDDPSATLVTARPFPPDERAPDSGAATLAGPRKPPVREQG